MEESARAGRTGKAMTDLTAKRTLVKSPPELWAELSEVESLARHLGEFGEIRIIRTEPQSTVAWEGEHASGTVALEESGWGTKVTLTAAVQAEEAAVEEPEALEAPAPAPGPQTLPHRRRFFARWRRRPRAQPEPVPEQRTEPVMAAAIADGAVTVVEKGHGPRRPSTPVPQPALDVEGALAVLENTLDSLGQAHHRPFSRE